MPERSFDEDELLRQLDLHTIPERYGILVDGLTPYREYFEGKRVMDFGCSIGMSAAVMVKLGVGSVVGVEPDPRRVDEGRDLLRAVGLDDRVSIEHVADTSKMPYDDGSFDFILVNAVLEHIPQPRAPYVRELWRVLDVGGHLLITETPNIYYPKETHTTGLWFNHWLPRDVAHRRAIRTGTFDADRDDWDSSGWRGLGWMELKEGLGSYRLIPETKKLRHRVSTALGLPASWMDPYPIWLLQKV